MILSEDKSIVNGKFIFEFAEILYFWIYPMASLYGLHHILELLVLSNSRHHFSQSEGFGYCIFHNVSNICFSCIIMSGYFIGVSADVVSRLFSSRPGLYIRSMLDGVKCRCHLSNLALVGFLLFTIPVSGLWSVMTLKWAPNR